MPFVPGGGGSGSGGGASLFPVIAGHAAYVASTGSAGADTAAIQAAHDAFSSSGGTIALDQGPYVWTQGGVNFTKPIHLLGTGPNGPNVGSTASYLTTGSVIDCSSSSGNGLTINSDGFTGEKLSIINSAGSPPSAGAGIQIATLGKNWRLIDTVIYGFYDDLSVINGYEWYVDRCHFFNPVHDGVRIQDQTVPDGGDGTIIDSFIFSGPTNATPANGIEWNSGGGLKVISTKINARTLTPGFTVGVNFAVSDGSVTGVGIVDACSVENTVWGVIVQNAAGSNTGQFSRVIISDNEFDVLTTSGNCIGIAGGTTGKIADVTVEGNICDGGLFGILLANVDKVRLRGNSGTLNPIMTGVTNLTIASEDYPYSTAGRPPASVMAAGSSYYDSTLKLPGFADGAGNWKNAAGANI